MDLKTALVAEIEILTEQFRNEARRGQTLLDDAVRRAVSTHAGHNLGSVASELSAIAGKIEQTRKLLAEIERREKEETR